jgi:glycine/D-amino acid oxidase-like deaminating enzyme
MMPLGSHDVAIVGGGIVGCATAYHLARRGLSVAIIERGNVAGEQSSRAWGFIRQLGRHSAEAPLAALAGEAWPRLESELEADLEFVRAGVLVAAQSAADEARIGSALDIAKASGIRAQLLSAAEIRMRIPGATDAWKCGLLAADDGHAEPVKAARAFSDAAKRLGVTIHERTRADAIDIEGGRAVGLQTDKGTIRANAVVCAAGIGAADLCRAVGVDLPIKAVRATVAESHATHRRFDTAIWSPHVAVRPRRDGTFVVGNGYRGIDAEFDVTIDAFHHLGQFLPTLWLNRKIIRLTFGAAFFEDLRRRATGRRNFAWSDPRPNMALVARNAAGFREAFPELRGLGMRRAWAGRIDATPDLIPIIDAIDRPKGLYVAAGFNGHGFALSPVVGQLLARMVAQGGVPDELRSFAVSRFRDGSAKPQSNAL